LGSFGLAQLAFNKMGNSFLLIVAGLLLFYLVISDKWKCIEGFGACVLGQTGAANGSPITTGLPSLPNVTNPQPIGMPNLSTLALQSNWAVQNGF
jgi:hypothetical protein